MIPVLDPNPELDFQIMDLDPVKSGIITPIQGDQSP